MGGGRGRSVPGRGCGRACCSLNQARCLLGLRRRQRRPRERRALAPAAGRAGRLPWRRRRAAGKRPGRGRRRARPGRGAVACPSCAGSGTTPAGGQAEI